MKNLFFLFTFVLGSMLMPHILQASGHPLFQVHCDSMKMLIDKAKLDEAKAILPILDSLAKVHPDPETEADLLFYRAYYWLFKVGEVKSLELLTKASVAYNALGISSKANLAESFICINLYFLGRYEDCEKKGEKLLQTIPLEEKEARGMLHNILGAMYGGAGPEGDAVKGLYHVNKAIPYFKEEKNYRRLLSLYGLLAAHYNAKGDYQTALIYIDSSSACANLLDNQRQVHFLKIRKSNALSNMNKDAEALELLKEAEEYYGKHGSEHGEMSWIIGLQMRHFEKQGDYKRAYDFLDFRDSIGHIERTQKNEAATNNLMVKYETEKKEQQIKIQALEIQNEKERNQQLVFAALGGLSFLLLIFGGAYFYYRQKQQEKLRNAQLNYQKQLLETTVETQEEERKRIARDLHDGIGQQMSGLKMGFQTLAKNISELVPAQQPLVTKLDCIINEAASDIRNLSHQMMPKALSELGVVPAIEDMLDKSFASNELSYDFEHFGMEKKLSDIQAIGLYRIAQELVSNILKHAQATEVDIQLMRQNSQILFIVEDNGLGFDPDEQQLYGHGMLNMQSRLQAIGGSIAFECPEKGGTIATVRIKT